MAGTAAKPIRVERQGALEIRMQPSGWIELELIAEAESIPSYVELDPSDLPWLVTMLEHLTSAPLRIDLRCTLTGMPVTYEGYHRGGAEISVHGDGSVDVWSHETLVELLREEIPWAIGILRDMIGSREWLASQQGYFEGVGGTRPSGLRLIHGGADQGPAA